MSPITFVTVGLTAGAALAAIPVIIHLIMRQTPKHVVFPALRLIRERQKQSRKRLRIRNWLLLLARMALIALMALALARPKLYSQSNIGDREVPTALALVFDTSYSMEYRDKDKTRLREAQDHALALLGRVHESSQVFVVDSAEFTAPPPLSPAAARKRVEGLALRHVNRKLNAAMGLAYKAVAGSNLDRHEVYVFTDLARTAWDLGPGKTAEGLDEIKKVKDGVNTYLIRLGVPQPRDVAIVSAEPEAGVAIENERVKVRAKLRATGPAASRRVELYIDGIKRNETAVTVPAGGEVDVPPLETPKLAAGLYQGEVRLGGEPDPLAFDDRRYFTLDVQPSLKALLVSEREIDAFYVRQALFPDEAIKLGQPWPYRVTQVAAKDLAARGPNFLRDFAAVFLLNVKSLPPESWGRLRTFVHDGGGLVVALGDLVDPANYNAGAAANLLPAAIDVPYPKGVEPPTSFGEGAWDHPLLARAREEIQKDLASVSVYRRATVTPRAGARAILSFQDKAPALLERVVPGSKPGHVLMWTIPLSRRPVFDPAQSVEYWSDFALDHWSFQELLYRAVPYLAGLGSRQLTYEAGEDVTLPVEAARRYTSFAIRGPDAKTADHQGKPDPNVGLVIEAPGLVGAWTVVASGPDVPDKALGFSVNPAPDEDRVAPLVERDLERLFGGKDRYKLADNAENLRDVVIKARIGREIFPWLMALILALITAENVLANRFYKQAPAAAAPNPAR